ncbi:MAG TPA: hypothetical protein VHX86_20170 [Tepidisphaeraceae bacterium]|jgi:hypothetical protein|nr:hypothetical protein [Tepidisphaeraceae bacterium]
MRLGICWAIIAVVLLLGRCAPAQDLGSAESGGTGILGQMVKTDLALETALNNQEDPFASGEPSSPPEWGDQHLNNGGTHFSLDFAYANKYVYRGLDHDVVASHGNSLNLLIDGRLEFDFGKYPHPFVELFTNIYDADPISRFQEIRPIVGADWNLRPFDLELENIDYIYPDREAFNVPEIDTKITFDDSLLFDTAKPIFSPYVLGAFVYQKNQGWYLEFGVKHDFSFEDLGLVITPEVNVGWISGLNQQFVIVNPVHNTGWQHFEFGVTISYSLNVLLNVSKRYGEFDVKGYGFYDDRLSTYITASNAVWGGIGLGFKY